MSAKSKGTNSSTDHGNDRNMDKLEEQEEDVKSDYQDKIQSDGELRGAQEPIGIRNLKTVKCDTHRRRDLCMFCQSCNIIICTLCVLESHGDGHVKCDMEAIYSDKLDILRRHEHTLNHNIIPFFNEEKNKLLRVLISHESFCEDMKRQIKEQENRLITEIRQQTKALKEELDNWLQFHSEEVTSRISLLEETCVALCQTNKLIRQASRSDNIEYICRISDQVSNHVENMDVASIPLPRVNQKYIPGDMDIGAIKTLVGTLEETLVEDTAEVKLELLKTYATDLNAIGKICVANNRVWIKNSTQELMRDIKLGDELSVEGETQAIKVKDIALKPNGDMLLAIENDCHIRVVKKGQKEINTFFSIPKPGIWGYQLFPVAIHAVGDKIIAGTAIKDLKYEDKTFERKIIILSEDQNELIQLNSFELNENKERLFNYPYRIKTLKNGDILILDKLSIEHGKITLLSMEGEIKWRYIGSSLTNPAVQFDPCDIVTTSHNNIVVCDMRSNLLHILNSNGHLIACNNVSECFDIQFPASADFDHEGNLIIGCGTKYRQEAKIHKLKCVGF